MNDDSTLQLSYIMQIPEKEVAEYLKSVPLAGFHIKQFYLRAGRKPTIDECVNIRDLAYASPYSISEIIDSYPNSKILSEFSVMSLLKLI